MSKSRLTPPSVLESSLYCADLEAAERFYREVLGLELVASQAGRHVFLRCGTGMVLLFNPEATADPTVPTGGPAMTPHGAHGPGHLAFRLPEPDIERWQAHLAEAGVSIEAEVRWPQGGYSLYFRDPAGNSLELATAALWGFSEGSQSPAPTPEQWQARDYRQSARDLDAWAKDHAAARDDDTTEYVAKLGLNPAGSVVAMNRAHDQVLIPPPARAPLAAFALADQPFGFTLADVELVEHAADQRGDEPAAAGLRDLARRIKDLLPTSSSS